jgi:hypothetical protein
MAKCHPVRIFFRPRRSPLSHDSQVKGELEFKRIPRRRGARARRQSAKGPTYGLNVLGE